jgi:hypothetical protein
MSVTMVRRLAVRSFLRRSERPLTTYDSIAVKRGKISFIRSTPAAVRRRSTRRRSSWRWCLARRPRLSRVLTDRETGPAELDRAQDLGGDVRPDGVGGPVDARDGLCRLEVEGRVELLHVSARGPLGRHERVLVRHVGDRTGHRW